jgi:hypothetical protein
MGPNGPLPFNSVAGIGQHMTAELGDERSFKRGLREIATEVGKERIQAAVDDAVRMANRALREAGNNPPPEATLDEWSVEAIADSVEVYWENGEPEGKLEQGDVLVAEWTHPHADKIEVGVRPHEIEGDPILVFEWHNIPEDVADEFRSQWENPESFLEEPMVAYARIDHPGIPAVGYIRSGFRKAINKHFG